MRIALEYISRGERHLVNQYIKPAVYSAYPLARLMTIEAIQIVAVGIFLEVTRSFFLQATARLSQRDIFCITFVAPMAEEIIFRGVIVHVIHELQKGWNYVLKKELTEEEQRVQQLFRIHLSASLFALAHLTNSHKNATSALIQFSWTYLAGVSYGYLHEKYHTLSISMLAHGVNNLLAVSGMIFKRSSLCLIAIIVNQLVFYVLATGVTSPLKWSKQNVSESCLALSKYLTAFGLAHMLYSRNVQPLFLLYGYSHHIHTLIDTCLHPLSSRA